MEIERLKAASIKPEAEFGEPHFKKYESHISIPLTMPRDGAIGRARFTGECTIRIAKMGEIILSRSFPVLNYRYKMA